MYICQFCNKEYNKNSSLLNHSHRCSLNPNRAIQNGRKGKAPWNKGKTGLQTAWNKGMTGLKGTPHSEETKKRLSEVAKEKGLGGHTSKTRIYFKKNSGEEIYLQSSYEVKFAELLEEMNIVWERPDPLSWIDSNGISHKYYPDFKIGKKYFDTKNDYLALKDADKINRVSKQNNVTVEIVTYSNITKEYIKNALIV